MWTKKFWMDAAERAFWTFGEAFVSFIVIDSAVDADLSWGAKLSAAAIAGAISVGKSFFIGRNVGSSNTASTLPAEAEPTKLSGVGR